MQDEKFAGSMIGNGKLEAVYAAVATSASLEGTGWFLIVSDHDGNSVGCNNLIHISRRSRPRVPWLAGFFKLKICLRCFDSVVAAISLSRFEEYTACFLEKAIQSRII